MMIIIMVVLILFALTPFFVLVSLLPSLMREGSYSTIRLGAYEPLKVYFGATDPAHTPLWKKICAGAISGWSKGGNPFFVKLKSSN